MKRKTLLCCMLVLVFCLSAVLLVACNKGISDEILGIISQNVYDKHKSDVQTPDNYTLPAVNVYLDADDKEYSVNLKWEISGTTEVKIGELDGKFYPVTVPAVRSADISYKLKVTLVDENQKAYTDKEGKEYSHTFDRVVPKSTGSEQQSSALEKATVKNPVAGTAYKWVTFFNYEYRYFDGTKGSQRLNTVDNFEAAVDVFVETVEGGGYRLYFMNNNVKTYINMTPYVSGDKSNGVAKPEHSSDEYMSTSVEFQTDVSKVNTLKIHESGALYIEASMKCAHGNDFTAKNMFAVRDKYPNEIAPTVAVSYFTDNNKNHVIMVNECPMYLVTENLKVEQEDLTTQQILDKAFALGANEAMDGKWTLEGTVTAWAYSESYKNGDGKMTVLDKEITLFRLAGSAAKDIAVGDKISVSGVLENHTDGAVNEVRFKSGASCEIIGKGQGGGEEPDPVDPPDTTGAITAAAVKTAAEALNLEDKAYSENSYKVLAYVVGVKTKQLSNLVYDIDLADAAGAEKVFALYHGNLIGEAPEVGDKVLVIGHITRYGTTLQIGGKGTKDVPYATVQIVEKKSSNGSIKASTNNAEGITVTFTSHEAVDGVVSGVNGTEVKFTVAVNINGKELDVVKVGGEIIEADEHGVYTVSLDGVMEIVVDVKDEGVITDNIVIKDYATANSWKKSTKYESINTSNVTLTAKGGSNTGKYYDSNKSWRIYSSENGLVTIAAKGTLAIKSITVTYESGTLKFEGNAVTSGTAITVNNTAIDLIATSGSPNITGIALQYVESATLPEAKIGETTYDTLAAAVAAAQENDTIILQKNVVLDEQLDIAKKITLNLNWKKISNTEKIWDKANGKYALISVVANGEVTINGNGTIEALENDCWTLMVNGGKLIIENGTIIGNIDCVYVALGSAEIKGGSYSLKQLSDGEGLAPYRFTLNLEDQPGKDGTATIVVTGGTFENYDPSHSKSEAPEVSFVKTGYVVNMVQGSGKNVYTVVAATAANTVNITPEWFVGTSYSNDAQSVVINDVALNYVRMSYNLERIQLSAVSSTAGTPAASISNAEAFQGKVTSIAIKINGAKDLTGAFKVEFANNADFTNAKEVLVNTVAGNSIVNVEVPTDGEYTFVRISNVYFTVDSNGKTKGETIYLDSITITLDVPAEA